MYAGFLARVELARLGRTIRDSCIEYERHIRADQLEKSALAERCRVKGHQALLESATVISRVTGYREAVITESVEVCLDHTAVNRYIGLQLNLARRPALKLIGSIAGGNRILVGLVWACQAAVVCLFKCMVLDCVFVLCSQTTVPIIPDH